MNELRKNEDGCLVFRIEEVLIESNLGKMRGNSRGEMVLLLMEESIGGNAGHAGQYPCIAANFFFNPFTGEIVYFGNWQHVPEKIRENNAEGTFRLAIDWNKSWKLSVVDTYIRGACSDAARCCLEETVQQYNGRYGFVIEEETLK